MAAPSFAAGGEVGNLSGTVVDADTRAPLSGAHVTAAAPTGTFKATTDAHGFFTILGMPVDTYALSIEYPGYEPITQTGITLTGDQTVGLGQLRVPKELRTIARTTSRSISGAFQPTQTIDSYSISGNRLLQTTGKSATTNENALLLAVPGVTLTNQGSPTIRGGAAREVGYQYDGVSFVEPFLGVNGSSPANGAGLFNGIGNVQVVEGAGDATQGNVGSGVINVIPKRGSYPGFGFVDAEVGGPNYFHQFAFEYGIATKDNTLSDYIAYNGQRFDPYHGYSFTSAGPHGSYFSTGYQMNDQFTNNLVFKFGKNKSQSLQVLYTNISLQQLGDRGGIPSGVFDPTTNPNALVYYPYDTLSQAPFYQVNPGVPALTPTQYASLIGLGPGVPSTNTAITSPQLNQSLQTRFLKFEYDNNISANTFLALRYYNWDQLDSTDNQYSLGPAQGGISVQQVTGGPIVGTSLDLTHQFGSNLTVSINGKYENQHPVWDAYEPQIELFALGGTPGPGSGPTIGDWLPGGYVYDYFTSRGEAVPRIPAWGISYNGSFFQDWGTGIRFQYNPTSRVKTDLGVRYEGQNQHWINQLGQYGITVPGNPYSVVPSSWTNSTLFPTEIEPRAGITYLMGVNDSLRAGYGRSAVFSTAQTAGTPYSAWNLGPYMNIPPLPGFACGVQITYVCKSYGEQLYWAGDAAADAPDAGNGKPAVYSNYDLSYQHQFKNGWGARLTPFYKLGTDLPAASIIAILPGGQGVFGIGNAGLNRTTGVEFNLTTPDKPYGLSGFFSATYQNVLGTTPPLVNDETNVPQLSSATLALGNQYRAGYVSPFSMRIGGTLNTKGGIRITPDLQYDIGYPFSSGNLVAAQIGVDANGNPIYANVPQVNFGAGEQGLSRLFGIQNVTGTNLATNYYDPAFPGTALNPNIVATRGTPASAASGGFLSPANLQADLTIEYKRAGNTFGVQLLNLFGNAFVNAVPAVNPFYQPAGNGLSGPRTGINNCTPQYGTARGCSNIPTDIYAYTNGAYLLTNGDFTDVTSLAPLRPFTIQVYYQRQL